MYKWCFVLLVVCCVCFTRVNSQLCMNNCSGRGVCLGSGNDTYCQCFYAFFASDCSITVANQMPNLWLMFQVVETVINIVWFLFFFTGAIFAPRNTDLEKSNVTRITLIFMATLCFIGTLHYGIDPYGAKFMPIPYIFICLLDGVRFPTALFTFGVIVFHWVEVYQETIRRLNEQEMLAKINKDYDKEVTLEDIMSNVRSVHRFRVPFTVVLILLFIYRIIGMIMRGILNPSWYALNLSFNIIMILCFALISIGSIYFGRKLYHLFPKPLDARMKGLTINVVGLSIFGCLALIAAAGYYAGQKYNQYQLTNWLVGDLVMNLLFNVAGGWLIFIFEGQMIRKFIKRVIIMSSSGTTEPNTSLDKDLSSITNTE